MCKPITHYCYLLGGLCILLFLPSWWSLGIRLPTSCVSPGIWHNRYGANYTIWRELPLRSPIDPGESSSLFASELQRSGKSPLSARSSILANYSIVTRKSPGKSCRKILPGSEGENLCPIAKIHANYTIPGRKSCGKFSLRSHRENPWENSSILANYWRQPAISEFTANKKTPGSVRGLYSIVRSLGYQYFWMVALSNFCLT